MSNKKPFEYIEHRIKQAAENSQPAYDEQAWQKMEALLDKKEKRKPLLWWWFLLPVLLISSWGIYWLITTSTLAKTKSKTVNNTSAANVSQKKLTFHNDTTASFSADKNTLEKVSDKANSDNDFGVQPPGKNRDVNAAVKNSGSNTNFAIPTANKKQRRYSHAKTSATIRYNTDQTIDLSEQSNTVTAGKPGTKPTAENLTTIKQEKAEPEKQDSEMLRQTVTTIHKKDTSIIKANNSRAINKKQTVLTSKGFYILGAAGTDDASVNPFSYKNSKVKVKYGLGIGYQLNGRWSVQTGLYISNKKYIAGPADYHPKKGSYWDMVEIKKVDANCLVYEIPVTIKYNFIQRKSVTYYGALSASSYIMKEENCDYHYLRSGNYYEKYWEYTGNKHLFSTLTISAGIEKSILPKIALFAEPSFSMPLSGVGDGSVKLFSTSLLLGVKYKPFQKR